MKNNYIYSALAGGVFFATSYLGVGLTILPSILIAGVAFGAGNLVFNKRGNVTKLTLDSEKNLYEILKEAKENTKQIEEISKQLEDKELVDNVKEICSISHKMIDTISKKPEKMGKANHFFTYYLPVTIKILQRYDEIENQKLKANDVDEFMKKVQTMVVKIKEAFLEQLKSLYQSDMRDTDAEIKVFESMLKSDGYLNDINIDL